jgi:hypothetical protein
MALVALGALALSCTSGDLHFVNAIGATITAVCALLVVLQVVAEERWSDEDAADEGSSSEISPFYAQLVAKVINGRRSTRREARLTMVRNIAILLFCAELLHGWGDRAAKLLCSLAADVSVPPAHHSCPQQSPKH